MAAPRARTVPVLVKVYTEEYLIQGLIHTKPGASKDNISDIFNDPHLRFVTLTEASFRRAEDETTPFRSCPTLMVRVGDIKLLIPFEEKADSPEPPTSPGSSATW